MRVAPRLAHAAVACATAAALVAAAGCDRTRDTTPAESVVTFTPAPVDSAEPVPPASAWDANAGALVAVPASGPGDALLVFPELTDSTLADTTAFDPARARGVALDLFDRSGRIAGDTVAEMRPQQWTTGCIEWPTASLRGVPLRWTVGFVAGRAEPLPLDSLEALQGADSASLAAALTRLASQLPDNPESRFRGLPFRVRDAYRTRLSDGTTIVAADIVRRLTVEASPLEERTLLIAERDSASALRTVYHERAAGTEETVESTEILAAVRIGTPPHPALMLSRVGYESSHFTLLERVGPGRWRARWSSVTTGC